MLAMTKPAPHNRTQLALAADAVVAPPPAEPDLVDHIFEYLGAERLLDARGADLERAKAAVRDYFGGEGVYIARRPASARHALAVEVLSAFDGRNATEIARRLKIGRATVYRIIKQAGQR